MRICSKDPLSFRLWIDCEVILTLKGTLRNISIHFNYPNFNYPLRNVFFVNIKYINKTVLFLLNRILKKYIAKCVSMS